MVVTCSLITLTVYKYLLSIYTRTYVTLLDDQSISGNLFWIHRGDQRLHLIFLKVAQKFVLQDGPFDLSRAPVNDTGDD